jgi:hypothetical protein
MGGARWDPSDWKSYKSSAAGKSRAAIFGRGNIDPAFDPRSITVRESRDSGSNPSSNAIIVAFDETGSMGEIPDAFVRGGLGTMVEEILSRKPVSDPHVMIMGVGDAWTDCAPLQVTQFEADIRIAEQLSNIYLEGKGGGNGYESYNLPWYFAATRTRIDCFEKRNRKGYLFTIGDEPPPPNLLADHVRSLFGDHLERDMNSREVLTMASRMYEVFHIVIEQGSFFRSSPKAVRSGWDALLGPRVLYLKDFHRLAEVIVSAIELTEGRDRDAVANSWSGETAHVVAHALNSLVPANPVRRGLLRFFARD